ncbi:hypothetical protein HGP14_26430 [Rhizobium sp. P32RR-XVIII]|uniref:hypothetical protein n=1 Tax=Rhizobium sp. P32RR-XVIII TaxID=2726738 RepID=UPI001457395A|nr:hypothetical protein [Rhizobium sp. P32RR-XVIII]NLS06851.1 hypothetical protein [Rhizobium sp. P32RR-XVIII]
MARSALIFIAVLLSSCQSVDERVSAAAAVQGQARASAPFPDLPPACVAKMGRVRPGDEPWVITFKRWEIVADNRDRQADDCAAWGRDMKTRYAGVRH